MSSRGPAGGGCRRARRPAAVLALIATCLSASQARAQTAEEQTRTLSAQELRCLQLEQELANDWMTARESQNQIPKINAEIRRYEDVYRSTQAEADRAGCYESVFIFGRALRRTPKCLRLHDRLEEARRQVARLEEQKAAQSRRGTQRRRDDLIDELARYGCGREYEREARRGRGFFSWFSNEPFVERRRDFETSRIEPYATYRTLCVRTCDGYYFPISFSTLPSQFAQDAARCQSQCAAPAQLFVYRNPGEEPEQMVTTDGAQAYSQLPNAWKYRKAYIKGCSCKEAEYDPAEIAKAEAGGQDADKIAVEGSGEIKDAAGAAKTE